MDERTRKLLELVGFIAGMMMDTTATDAELMAKLRIYWDYTFKKS